MEKTARAAKGEENFLYPVPAVMISCGDFESGGNLNIITLSWVGVLCSAPPYLYVSIRPSRHSHGIIKETGDFVINIVTTELAASADFCGVKSGRDVDKFKETGLTPVKSQFVKAPGIAETAVNIECAVREIKPLGSHDVFIAEAVGVSFSDYDAAKLICNAGGKYYELGNFIGKFGYSIKK
ncbi:MAG: flavin reductase family protein [Clostridiales bacterium]|jgi:flavin reductase (DIM6/NTAB) family NADH-FMN oxidoreductase RutF|nr:flavin reductase family protein [Clostridiales bacterium]